MEKRRNHFIKLAPWLGLAAALLGAPSCSKTNNVDVSNGALPTGAECEPAADDPCAGTCVGGLCRPACGANRECPNDARCVGDGNAAACVPEDFGRLDLLRDCRDGCSLELAPFGREGYFFECDREHWEYALGYDEAGNPLPVGFPDMLAFGKPDIDPATNCASVSRKTHGVKGNLLFDVEGDDCRVKPFGVVGDKLVSLEPKHLPYLDTDTPSAMVGYLYDQGGATYWLSGYGLYRFESGAVDEDEDSCGGSADVSLTYPALGDVPVGFSGFWVKCPEAMSAEDCATLELGQGPWDPMTTGRPDMLSVRDDGYLLDYWWSQTCNGAYRSSALDADSVVVIRHYDENLWMADQRWSTFEAAGEAFLNVMINGITDEAYADVYRLMPRPAEFQYDPCDDYAPEVGF